MNYFLPHRQPVRCFATLMAMLVTSILPSGIFAQFAPGDFAPPPKKQTPATPTVGGVEIKKYDRINLGPEINSEASELFPIITPDESILFFVRKGDSTNTGFASNPRDEDIWYSTRQSNGKWGKSRKLEGPLNTESFDGIRAVNVAATRLYLQNIYNDDGTRAKGFSVSQKGADGRWSFPEALEIEDYYNDTTTSSMTVSVDEDVLIFSLRRKESVGKHDLYLSKRLQGNQWTAPALITSLSTPGDEISPFIANDDRTLYFSTDGRGGEGLHDVFVTRRLDDTWLRWSEPKNLGAPVNTPSFDAYFMVSGKGDTAYFSSHHESSTKGYGQSDIWKLGLSPRHRPGFDLPSADLTDESIPEQIANSLFRLDHVLFDVGKSTIRKESRDDLDKLAELLKIYPQISIEVQGHTDSDGDPAKNLRLSLERATAVKTYLMGHGIGAERVSAQGFGQTRPIAPNTTSAGKQLNRRVMVMVRGNISSMIESR